MPTRRSKKASDTETASPTAQPENHRSSDAESSTDPTPTPEVAAAEAELPEQEPEPTPKASKRTSKPQKLTADEIVRDKLIEASQQYELPDNMSRYERLRIAIAYVEPSKTCIWDDQSKSWVHTSPTNQKTALNELDPTKTNDRLTLIALAMHQLKLEMLDLAAEL